MQGMYRLKYTCMNLCIHDGATCLDFIKMACFEKTNIIDFHLKTLKLAEAEDNSESHSGLEVEYESLNEQDFSETEHDSYVSPY